MATVLLLMARQPDRWPDWLLAIGGAWFVSGVILYFAPFVRRFDCQALADWPDCLGRVEGSRCM
jgi:hypothetical protein